MLTENNDTQQTRIGALYAIVAYGFWGVAAIYWKFISHVDPTQLVAHRVVWSAVMLSIMLHYYQQWPVIKTILSSPNLIGWLSLSATFVSLNWLVFIWSVANNHLVESSLGYYINPIINVLLGIVFLQERLNRWQLLAVSLALAGISIPIFALGKIPWIALFLAFSFGFYGLIRKRTPVESLPGLFIETMVMLPIAIGYLIYTQVKGSGAFLNIGISDDLLMMLAGPMTVLPLLWVVNAAKRLRYSTLGFFQYIAPSGMFILGVVVYQEPFGKTQAMTFAFIWLALLIFSLSSLSEE